MATTLGGLWLECYVCENKSRELQAISRIDLKVSRFRLFAKAQPAEVRLRKTQAFFSAQNDRLIGCLVVCVRFREHQGAPLPVEMKRTEIRLFSGCRGRHPLPQILKFSVGAIHESPVFVHGMRFFSGAPRRSPTG